MSPQMPLQTPGVSKQDYGTPPDLLQAVRYRLMIDQFSIDLAADSLNAVCPVYYTLEDPARNAFLHDWNHKGWAWLNPPFGHIEPWVRKASEAWRQPVSRGRIAMLVPSSTGSNWWRDFVHRKALVRFLNGRLRFVGATDDYPKDTALLLFGDFVPNYDVWTWKDDVK